MEYHHFFINFQFLIKLNGILFINNNDISNGNNFESMFNKCSSLLDIKVLKKWNNSKQILVFNV